MTRPIPFKIEIRPTTVAMVPSDTLAPLLLRQYRWPGKPEPGRRHLQRWPYVIQPERRLLYICPELISRAGSLAAAFFHRLRRLKIRIRFYEKETADKHDYKDNDCKYTEGRFPFIPPEDGVTAAKILPTIKALRPNPISRMPEISPCLSGNMQTWYS